MALTLSQIQAATFDYYERRLVDIFFTENVLMWKLMGRGGMEMNIVKASELIDGGEKIRVFLEYAEANSGAYGNTTKIPQNKKDIVNAARFRWGGYFAANTIDLDEQVQNTGNEAMIKLVITKLRNIEKSIRNQMGSKIYLYAAESAATSKHWLGLGSLFNFSDATTYADDSSIAYGGIAEDDMAQWKANVIETPEAIGFKVMQKIWRTPAIGVAASKKPNLGITTELLKDGYERTLQTQQRFSDQDLVKAGFDNIMHKRGAIVADDNQETGFLDALNLNYLKIKTHQEYNFTEPKWEYDKEQPDAKTANTRYIGQLICSNRKAHCRHTNLSEAN